MKNSKLEGFREIPNDWKEPGIWILKQTRDIIDFQDGNHGELHPKVDDFTSEGRSFLTANQIDKYGRIDFENSDRLPNEFCKKLRIGFSKHDDVLFTHNATVGRVAVMPPDAPDVIVGTSITYYRFNPKTIENRFFAYLLKSDYIIFQYEPIMKQSTRNQFSILKQAKLHVLLPTNKEQKQIANYLDDKIQEIDNEIFKNEKLTKLLKEQKQSTINLAVTKGLDDSVSMKDSGIKWIGKIPEYWNSTKLKYIVKLYAGYSFKSTDFVDSGIPVLKIFNVSEEKLDWSQKSFLPDMFWDKYPEFQIKQNDLVIAMTRPIISFGLKISFFNDDFKCLINQRVGKFFIKKNIIPVYLFYLLCSKYVRENISMQLFGTVQPNISSEDIERIVVPLPPIHEQKQIVDYLDKKIKKSDLLISKVELQIKKLQEFRESLISSTVTGKIQVAQT